MPLTATISINVDPLPDNDVWFSNAASWTNYWADVQGDVEFDAIENTVYAASAYVEGDGVFVMILEDGSQQRLVREAMYLSLLNRVNVLNASYELLRTELRNAGLITQAQ